MKKSYILPTLLIALTIIACSGNKKDKLITKVNAEELVPTSDIDDKNQKTEVYQDTTIYNTPPTTALLENASAYFRTNNKYKDWNKNDERKILLKAIIEKDGTPTNLHIVGGWNNKSDERIEGTCGNKELDEEALRLIRNAKISPATNESEEAVRSNWIILVHFPPK